jgi:hypothetical protein
MMDAPETPHTVGKFGKVDDFDLLDGGGRLTNLPVDKLKSLGSFQESLESLLRGFSDAGSRFGLKTVEVGVEVGVGIDGTGPVGYLGTGVEVGAGNIHPDPRPVLAMFHERNPIYAEEVRLETSMHREA